MKQNQRNHTQVSYQATSAGLKEKFERHYRQYDRKNIAPDPLQFPHRYSNPPDIELVAFLASVYAFGNVKQISSVMEKILELLGSSPANFLKFSPEQKIVTLFASVKHRFYRGEDTVRLLLVLRNALLGYGSVGLLINSLIPAGKRPGPKMIIGLFHDWFIIECKKHGHLSRGLKFMIPDPKVGSACKRFNLFLRWMVRKDELDFGLWDFISPADLVIPVDTHIAQIARMLGLSSRKNPDWKMSVEITARLREFDPSDPVKYDFSLCHIGIRGLEF